MPQPSGTSAPKTPARSGPTRTEAVARTISPARTTYRGPVTRPERWSSYAPRPGDILVSTPAKSGTTWTQAILCMLLNGGPDLPMPVPEMSPWVDADLGIPEAVVAERLAAQGGRRVVKTHTPLDGVAVWEGVTVVTVYRHPLDVCLSLRRHYLNTVGMPDDLPMMGPVAGAVESFLTDPVAPDSYSGRTLAALALHYRRTLESDRAPRPALLHYADMRADPRGTVARLAEIAGLDADARLVDRVTEATGFAAMKRAAPQFTPAAGTGHFHADDAFFASAGLGAWEAEVGPELRALFEARLAELVPDAAARAWLTGGDAAATPPRRAPS